ncbi:unnamed protein product [Candidula unifasciata]|uniref:BRCA1-associated RING domain protein 1 n=1 Tax=Candidula unifasciata TaxID=100452 RepID=A0A8S3YS00_9EUPU|nr:unnamed protein product [Candidula unifasciata]
MADQGSSQAEVNEVMFPQTRSALIHLQNYLQCRKCCQVSKELFTLGQCEHRFCGKCAQDRQGAICPLCNIPSYATEARVDKQLSNIASLCWLMSDILNGKQLPLSSNREIVEKQTVAVITPRRNESKNAKSDQRSVQKCSDHSSKNMISVMSSSVIKAGQENNNKTSKNCPPNKSCKLNKCRVDKIETKTVAQDVTISAVAADRQAESDILITGGKSAATTSQKRQKKRIAHRDLKSDKLSVDSCKTPPKPLFENVREKEACKSTERSASKSKTYPNKRNAKGETPLQVATIKADVETVQRLLEEGANPNVRDNAGWTPLHEAVNHGHDTIAELLLNYGAAVNTPGFDNDTPLHDAVNNYHLECVRLLVSRGANTLARNIHGRTPLDQAQTDEMREMLLTASSTSLPAADINTSMVAEVGDQPLCLLGTALSKNEHSLLLKCAKMLRAKVVDDFSTEVSHLVTGVNAEGRCPRTLKYLNVVLAGQWVVNTKWLATCLEHNIRAPEEDFEIAGCTNNPQTLAPKKSRENKYAQLPGLFDGCQFYFHGKFNYPTPSREELASLVKSGGGVILTREPRLHSLDDYPYTIPFHAPPTSGLADCAIFVIYDDTCPEPPHVEAQRMTCLPVSWLLDSIASFTLLDKTVYLKH